jgi:PST family polysaccharide transporter
MSAAANARWIALTQLVKIGSQLVNMFVLTKLIAPLDYGLMAMAGVATNLAFILRDLGTAAAIIQKADLSEADTSSVFWLNMAGGALLMLALWIVAPLMSSMFAEPRLTNVLWVLALTFPLAASSTVHQALLERVSQFRLIAGIESASSLLSLLIALALAFHGAGVWGLVAQALMMTSITTLLLWWYSSWRPSFVFDRASLRSVFSFSGSMAGHQMASYLFRNADSFVVGRLLGATVLGNYSLAYKLMLFPVQNISWVAVRSLFPVMSRRQDDKEYLADLTLRSIKLVSFISAPMMFGVAGVSDLFVHLFLGSQWYLVGQILALLSFVGYVQVITSIASPVFMSLGKTSWMLRISLVGTPLHILAFVTGALLDGVRGLAIGYLIASLLMALPVFYFCCQTLSIPLHKLTWALLPSVLSSAAMVLCITMCRDSMHVSGYLLFFSLTALGVVSWLAMVALFQRSEARDFMNLAFRRIKKS